jgi:hypothetical protein
VNRTKVHRWLRKWQKKLLMHAWRYEVEFSEKSHRDTTEREIVFASVVADPAYLTVGIVIHPEFWTLSDEDKERRLLHELVHGPVEQLAILAGRAVRRRTAIAADVNTAAESLVEWFTNVLWTQR